jgi:hypothetical protein
MMFIKMKSAEQVHSEIAAAVQNSLVSEQAANEIAFHMTDWKDDLQRLLKLYDEDQSVAKEEIDKIVFGFLAHVTNHLAAATKLIGLGPIKDVFEVGILEEDE